MQIALYNHHDDLPFGPFPEQPNRMFNPDAMENLLMWVQTEEPDPANKDLNKGKDIPFKETLLWAMLQGLRRIDLPIMAHASINFPSDGRVESALRTHVQISTMPGRVGHDGLPVIVNRGWIAVESLWESDKEAYVLSELLPPGVDMTRSEDPIFWEHIFLGHLIRAKNAADQRVKRAIEEAARYWNVR